MPRKPRIETKEHRGQVKMTIINFIYYNAAKKKRGEHELSFSPDPFFLAVKPLGYLITGTVLGAKGALLGYEVLTEYHDWAKDAINQLYEKGPDGICGGTN